MKKTQKMIGASFFGLIALTFFMLLLNNLTRIISIIELFGAFKEMWHVIVVYFLDVLLCFAICTISLNALVRIRKNKDANNRAVVKMNGFLLFLYFINSLMKGAITVLLAIKTAGGLDPSLISLIILYSFEAVGALFALLVALTGKCKILGGIAYAILFVESILSVTSVDEITKLQTVYTILISLVSIFGAIHVFTYEVNEDKAIEQQKDLATIEEKKEENSDDISND